MNIPVIPVGDVTQGLPSGAIQSVTSGTLAGGLGNDFAITFGATLRQSEQQGKTLQKGDVKEVAGAENSKPAVAGSLSASVLEATGLFATDVKSPKAGNAEEAIDSQTSGASQTNAKGPEQTTNARLDEKAAVSKTESEAADVFGVDKTIKGLSSKSVSVLAKSDGLGISNKATGPVKTTSAILQPPIEAHIPAALQVAFDGNTQIPALANAAGHGTDTSSTDLDDELAVSLPGQFAAVSDLKNELATGMKVSEKARSNASVLGVSTPPQSAAAKTAAQSGTAVKLQGGKTMEKAGEQSTASGVATAATVLDAPPANAIPFAFAPTAAATDTLATPAEMRPVVASPGQPTKDFDPANPDEPVIAEMSAGESGAPSRMASKEGNNEVTAVKSDRGSGATERISASTVPNSQDGAAAVTQAAYPKPVPALSSTAAVFAHTVERTVRSVQQTTPATTSTLTASTATAPQQRTLKLRLETATQAGRTGVEDADSASYSAQQSSDASTTLADTVAAKPIEKSAVTAVTEVAIAGTERIPFQELLEQLKQSSASSTTQQTAQSDITGAVTKTIPAASSTTSAHAVERTAPNAPVVAANAGATNAVLSGLPAPGLETAATAPAHSVSTPTGSAPGSVVSIIDAGRLSATAATATADPLRTIVATPTTLEVGVPNGTQGWLRIRAEVGDQGGVNASLSAGSNAGQEMLHRELPALNAYLHSEQISVTTSVTDRVFAAAGSSLAGMAAGSNGACPDASGRSMNQDATAHQGPASQNAMTLSAGTEGDGTQGNSGRQDIAPAFETAAIDDSRRSYDTRIGASDAVGAQATRDGESGRWLNVRA